MALRFMDSFDHYTTFLQKWTSWASDAGGIAIGAAGARTGANGARITNASYAGGYRCIGVLTLTAQGTWIMGFAYRVAGIAATDIATTRDAGTVQGHLRLNADGTLSLLRGATVVATSSRVITAGVFQHIEFKHIIHSSTGTLEVRVNGVVWATFTGNTQQTANATANQLGIGADAYPASHTTDYDDVYILDGAGSAPNNAYWGDTAINCLLPSGAGNYTGLDTLVGAATHYQAVDEAAPNDDTDYVADDTVDAKDSYAYADLAGAGTIYGVQVLIRAKKDVAGTGNVARLYRNASTDNQGADVALGTSYGYVTEILETDPIAAGVWTVTNVNSAEFGVVVR